MVGTIGGLFEKGRNQSLSVADDERLFGDSVVLSTSVLMLLLVIIYFTKNLEILVPFGLPMNLSAIVVGLDRQHRDVPPGSDRVWEWEVPGVTPE